MRTSMLRSLSLLALAGAGLSAQAAVIDFEGLPEGPLASYGGVTFTNASVLRAGETLGDFIFPPHSGVGVITSFPEDGPITIAFGSAQSSVGAYVTTSDGPVTLRAFSGGTLIGVVTTPFSTNHALFGDASPNYFLNFAGSGITSVQFADLGTNGTMTIDDLTFTPQASSAVPGPMAALPFAMIALNRRRKRA